MSGTLPLTGRDMGSEFEEIGAPLPTALPHEARKTKSPGRVAAARRLNELGLRGPGGRLPVHGIRAIEVMLARGEEPPGKIGQLLANLEGEFLADLGGSDQASAKETGLCRRLAEVELLIGLVKARLTTTQGGPRRLTWAREKDLLTIHARLSDSFTRTASALGLQRRSRNVTDLARAIQEAQEEGWEQAEHAQESGGDNGDRP